MCLTQRLRRNVMRSLYIRITRIRIGRWPSAQMGRGDHESLRFCSAEFWHTTAWPGDLTYKMFKQWFDIEINSMAIDLCHYRFKVHNL